jgi:hypothetical protein
MGDCRAYYREELLGLNLANCNVCNQATGLHPRQPAGNLDRPQNISQQTFLTNIPIT